MNTSPTSSAILINDVVSDGSVSDNRDDKRRLIRPRSSPRNNFLSYSNDGINIRFRVSILSL